MNKFILLLFTFQIVLCNNIDAQIEREMNTPFDDHIIKLGCNYNFIENSNLTEGGVFKLFLSYETNVLTKTSLTCTYSYLPYNIRGLNYFDALIFPTVKMDGGTAHLFELGVKRYLIKNYRNAFNLFCGIGAGYIPATYHFGTEKLHVKYFQPSINFGVSLCYKRAVLEIQPLNIAFVHKYHVKYIHTKHLLYIGIRI